MSEDTETILKFNNKPKTQDKYAHGISRQ